MQTAALRQNLKINEGKNKKTAVQSNFLEVCGIVFVQKKNSFVITRDNIERRLPPFL